MHVSQLHLTSILAPSYMNYLIPLTILSSFFTILACLVHNHVLRRAEL